MATKVIEQVTEKVVGTSFQEHKDILEFAGEYKHTNNVPTKVGVAVIVPEPENPYDSKALAVITKLSNGQPHKIGYIGRNSDIYNTVTSPTQAVLTISAYSAVGKYNCKYNDSYSVTVDYSKNKKVIL